MDDKNSAVIEKIKKLLALANSSNEHEAALAASHAQRLLSEHNLAMADIDDSHKPEKADTIETDVPKTLPKWLRHLSAGVSASFDCQSIHSPATGKMMFIGVGADVQVACYTFSHLNQVLRKISSLYMKYHVNARIIGRQREFIKQSYLLGAAVTIANRLQQQKAQTPVTACALVPVKEGLIKQAMCEIGNLRTYHSRKSCIHGDAYNRGQADGRQIGIHKGIGGFGPENMKLT